MKWEVEEVVVGSQWGDAPVRCEELKRRGEKGWEFVESRKASHSQWDYSELVFGIPCTILTFKRPA